MNDKHTQRFRGCNTIPLLAGIFLILWLAKAGSPSVRAQEGWTETPTGPAIPPVVPMETATPAPNDYFSINTVRLSDGTSIDEMIINGPPVPPPGFTLERQAVTAGQILEAAGSNSLIVPAFNWFFGCSATSGAMIAAYYDRNGYPNMYTGPTNGGVMPLDNSVWPTWNDGSSTYRQDPLAASRNGLDGRTQRGSIDDYWISYNSSAPDPFITGGWTQHAWGDAIGDYMKTSQSSYSNVDGSTSFYYSGSSSPLTCSTIAAYGWTRDGTLGRKLFYEARGYTVADCYYQQTDNQVSGGFSFAQYRAEIDAGRPVMLNLAGHTIVGVGYDSSTNTVYLHDTWDYATHSMIWGGGYSGMALMGASIVNLAPMNPTLSVSKAGAGSGTVSSNPAGISCGLTCSSIFNFNTVVTLSAVSAPGSTFTGWSGSGCSGTGTCMVTMDTARSVLATFTLNPSLYVKPAGSGTCSSWADACSLQTALNAAISGQEIWVAAGTYKPTAVPTDRSTTFQLRSGVAIYGGFAGIETARNQRNPLTQTTILSGDIDNNDSQTPVITNLSTVTGNTTNSFHVITIAGNATLDGFTITAGYANGSSLDNRGGGMYASSGNPALANVTFSGNRADYGGGLYINSGSPILTNITFSSNLSGYDGGGLYNSSGNPVLTNLTFSGNSAGEDGGGLYNSSSNPTLTNITLGGNSAVRFGGGMCNASSSPMINDTIFWGNAASGGGAQIYNFSSPPSIPSLNDSVVQAGCPAGSTCTNILTTDPLIGALGNYGGSTRTVPLLVGSSAIDMGKDTTCAASDQRGVPRPVGAHCDMGAFEFGLTISGNSGVGGATLSYTDITAKSVLSAADGSYSFYVPGNWSGTVTPSMAGYSFTPGFINYSTISTNQTDQNFLASPVTYTISGNAGVGGVTLSYTDGTPKTATADGSGNYTFTVSYNWSGTVIPLLAGYTFNPSSKIYSNMLADHPGENYLATAITYTISGNAGVGGATLDYTDGSPKAATADGSGNYTFTVSYNWSGTVKPQKDHYTFTPDHRDYLNVSADQTIQNYATAFIPPTFSDVAYTYTVNYGGVDYLLYPYIQALYDKHFTNGCLASPLSYCPTRTLNRAEAAKFLLNVIHGAGTSFTTLPPSPAFPLDNWAALGSWAQPWAEELYLENLTNGCWSSPLMYCPQRGLTREEAAKFGLTMKHINDPTPYVPTATGQVFADMTDTTYWATAWVEEAFNNTDKYGQADPLLVPCGMSGGKPQICPTQLIGRDWTAYLIVQAKELLIP
jgi:hypothetical protein